MNAVNVPQTWAVTALSHNQQLELGTIQICPFQLGKFQ
jgi:hypothetical protein